MDVYEPLGDTLTNRPVIIFIHSGSFFSGSNEADDMVDFLLLYQNPGCKTLSWIYVEISFSIQILTPSFFFCSSIIDSSTFSKSGDIFPSL